MALGTGRGDRPVLGTMIRRHISARSRVASDHMLKAYVLNFSNQSKVTANQVVFIERKYYQAQRIFYRSVLQYSTSVSHRHRSSDTQG